MKTIDPYRTVVSTFSAATSPAANVAQHQGFEYDSGEYILSIASPDTSSSTSSGSTSNSSAIAAALSDQSIVLYDTSIGQVSSKIQKAHDAPISELNFFPQEYNPQSQLLISAGQDGLVKVWDARLNNNNISNRSAAIAMKLALPNEQALSVSLGYGGTLTAVGTSKARVSFFDLRYTGNNNPSGALMGSYVDAHTDEVTKVRFQTIPQQSASQSKTVLATASEDGLIAIHDPSQSSEEAALLSVLNIGAPLRDVGFFGPAYEGMYALTGNETLSVHHWDSAQKVSDVGGVDLRGLLSTAVDEYLGNNKTTAAGGAMADDEGSTIEYLVGCTWAQLPTESSPALHLLAGNSRGDGFLFKVDADRITPTMYLRGGHKGCIRDFCWNNHGRLVTGGEDARLCEWDLLAGGNTTTFASTTSDTAARPMSGRSMMKSAKNEGSGNKKGKKKFGSPY